MALVCDTGVLIAIERRQPVVVALATAAASSGTALVVPTVCVAQAWRDGARQALLARFLDGAVVVPLDEATAREAGRLLAATGSSDVVDATVVATAGPGDVVLTGDPDDLGPLVAAQGAGVRLETL